VKLIVREARQIVADFNVIYLARKEMATMMSNWTKVFKTMASPKDEVFVKYEI
jgi:hypothetical protein